MLSEVPSLHCSVSLLHSYEPGRDYKDWDLHIHGIIIDFTVNDYHTYNATYLPEVAKEQGWSAEEAIESLVRKSGYKGKLTKTLLASIKLTRYQSVKVIDNMLRTL